MPFSQARLACPGCGTLGTLRRICAGCGVEGCEQCLRGIVPAYSPSPVYCDHCAERVLSNAGDPYWDAYGPDDDDW